MFIYCICVSLSGRPVRNGHKKHNSVSPGLSRDATGAASDPHSRALAPALFKHVPPPPHSPPPPPPLPVRSRPLSPTSSLPVIEGAGAGDGILSTPNSPPLRRPRSGLAPNSESTPEPPRPPPPLPRREALNSESKPEPPEQELIRVRIVRAPGERSLGAKICGEKPAYVLEVDPSAQALAGQSSRRPVPSRPGPHFD